MSKPAVKPFMISFSSPKTNREELTIHFLCSGKIGQRVTHLAVRQYIETHPNAKAFASGLEFRKAKGLMAVSASHEFVKRNRNVIGQLKTVVEELFARYEN